MGLLNSEFITSTWSIRKIVQGQNKTKFLRCLHISVSYNQFERCPMKLAWTSAIGMWVPKKYPGGWWAKNGSRKVAAFFPLAERGSPYLVSFLRCWHCLRNETAIFMHNVSTTSATSNKKPMLARNRTADERAILNCGLNFPVACHLPIPASRFWQQPEASHCRIKAISKWCKEVLIPIHSIIMHCVFVSACKCKTDLVCLSF